MSTLEYKINVSTREETGKSKMRRMRAAGFIPGIYYAPDAEQAIPFKVESKELHQALASDALIYHVSVGGQRKNVLINAIQYHPVTDEILHVDFHGVRLDEKVEVRVPIHMVGRPVGVRDEGGQLHQALLELTIKCLASDIPSHYEIDITELHLGEAIHAEELDIGELELVTPGDSMIVSVHKARGVLEEEVAEVEGEEFLFEEGEVEGAEPKAEGAPESSER